MFEGMSDDQVAVIGCGLAFFICMGMMVVSHSLRQALRKDAKRTQTPGIAARKIGEAVATETDERRKAA